MKHVLLICAIILSYISALAGNTENTNLVIENPVYWNTVSPIRIVLNSKQTNDIRADLSGLNYRIQLNISSAEVSETNIKISFIPPQTPVIIPSDFCLEVSESNRLHIYSIITDSTPPVVEIIKTSQQIKLGGSAIVIFKASDKNLKSVWLSIDEGIRFFPLKNEDSEIYSCLIAWPVYMTNFTAAVIAVDKAGNGSTNRIPIETKKVNYKISYLKIDNSFNTDKIKEFSLGATNVPKSKLKQYDLIMKEFQEKREINITEITGKPATNRMDFSLLKPFSPLSNAEITSPYGEHRYFKVNKKIVRESYHLGMDMASSKEADIFSSNAGFVEYTGYNGANGNMILIHHGMGLYSLYAHCSVILVKKGDNVVPGQVIAKTGHTGYALGDHLHFSIILYGQYINPAGWMNKKWLKDNVLDVVNSVSN